MNRRARYSCRICGPETHHPAAGKGLGGPWDATFSYRATQGRSHQRVGIVFAGGPAPAANAVISSAAVSFLDDGREVVGFKHGYENLQQLPSGDAPPDRRRALPRVHPQGRHGSRNSQGILIGTSRANPGKGIQRPADLEDPPRPQRLRNVYSAFVDLGIDALISIGGDDTSEDGELPLRVPEAAPAGREASRRSSTCPRRSTTTTRESTSPSATSPRSISSPRR